MGTRVRSQARRCGICGGQWIRSYALLCEYHSTVAPHLNPYHRHCVISASDRASLNNTCFSLLTNNNHWTLRASFKKLINKTQIGQKQSAKMYDAQQNVLRIILRHVRCECSSKSWSSAADRQTDTVWHYLQFESRVLTSTGEWDYKNQRLTTQQSPPLPPHHLWECGIFPMNFFIHLYEKEYMWKMFLYSGCGMCCAGGIREFILYTAVQ